MILLSKLVGSYQETVIFVADYMQVQFDDAILTIFGYPSVSKELNKVISQDSVDYYKTLISNNGHYVIGIDQQKDSRKILYDNKTVITISMILETVHPEVYMLQFSNNEWDVEQLI